MLVYFGKQGIKQYLPPALLSQRRNPVGILALVSTVVCITQTIFNGDRLPTIPAFRNPPLASLSTSPLFLRPTTTRYIPANPSSLRRNPTDFAIPRVFLDSAVFRSLVQFLIFFGVTLFSISFRLRRSQIATCLKRACGSHLSESDFAVPRSRFASKFA